MTKRFLLGTVLVVLALAGGCAKGGSGPCVSNCPALAVQGSSNGISPVSRAPLGLQITFTATFKYTSQTALNWTITGTSCSSSPTDQSNPCGYFTSSTTGPTITYQAPASVPSEANFNVVATAQSDSGLTSSAEMTIVPETAFVTPSPNVGLGLTQTFVATAEPDQVPETFTWSCTAAGSACQNFQWTPSVGGSANGIAYYTPVPSEECGNNCVQVTATSTLDPTGCSGGGCGLGQATVIASRVSGSYAFQFSGYDKNGKQIVVAGTFTVGKTGSITGFEDETSWNGTQYSTTGYTISNGSYTPINSSDPNSNNAGTLTLQTGVFPNTYQVVMDGAGDIQMIANDGAGDSGAGIAEPSSAKKFNNGTNATFAFGFTGLDSMGSRVGYAGLLPTDGVSSVTNGLIDVNDGGSSSNSICNPSSAPCAVTGSYSYDPNTNRGQLSLTSPVTMNFDFFVANGAENAKSPLTLYAISTDPITTNPAVLGTLAYQDPAPGSSKTYNNAAFSGGSVSALTGANGNAALVLGTTDGTSSGTGVTGACPGSNTGNFTGNFDQNNAGTILSVSPFPGAKQSPSPYTYVSMNNNVGRYIFCMLGNPSGNVLPIPFVLYASGANRGFLLDQSSPAVMTGPMNQQIGPQQNAGSFSNTLITSTYAVATNSSSVPNASACSPTFGCDFTMNLLLTAAGAGVFNLGGETNLGSQTVTGTYNVGATGYGTITLTAPAAIKYVIYGVTAGTFYVMEEDTGISSPLLFMAQ